MDQKRTFKALVVDDDATVTRLLVRGLMQQGFTSDTAVDGSEAEEKVAKSQYDAVVTDLRMPKKHGHALALHLLSLPQRPVIVVHTGLVEPKLAKDLLARGVDDILFKPFDIGLLATKVRVLVERKIAPTAQAEENSKQAECAVDEAQQSEGPTHEMPVSLANIESKLSSLSRILPVSSVGLDVYNMASTDRSEAPQIAAAIQQDATLAAEVLRLANSTFYNASGQRIVHLERAVKQIGLKRIGELALSTNALSALTSGLLPWLNVDLTWKRSMAAGRSIELLIEQGENRQVEKGLFLSAIMHPLGRVVLGTLFPKRYEMMIQRCGSNEGTLLEQERAAFPIDHSEVMANILASWKIPSDIHAPLRHFLADRSSLGKLPDPIRSQIDLLILAIFMGNVAIAQWESWDSIDIPPASMLRKMGISSPSGMLAKIKLCVKQLASLRADRTGTSIKSERTELSRELAYCDLSGSPFDFLPEITSPMGIKLIKHSPEELNDLEGAVLVNCVGVAPQRLVAKARRASRQQLLIVTDFEPRDEYREYGQTVALPVRSARLRTVCWEATHAIGRK
ncbi:MAG: HDOD domain-containing protein [Planctomycetota bacterium]|nr:HDOD domain-containing protein [Planctomycetota bacterium]